MKKSKSITTRTATELAEALGLSALDAAEMELRSELNDQIVRIVARDRWTYMRLANAAQTSRTRVTAILNRNTQGVSTDLMLRLLTAMGYRAKLTIRRYSIQAA